VLVSRSAAPNLEWNVQM